jgi:hypothetical protein
MTQLELIQQKLIDLLEQQAENANANLAEEIKRLKIEAYRLALHDSGKTSTHTVID